MYVKYVVKPSIALVMFKHMKELTLERNPMNVNTVVKPTEIPVP